MVAGFVCAGFSVLCFGVAFAQVVSPIDTGVSISASSTDQIASFVKSSKTKWMYTSNIIDTPDGSPIRFIDNEMHVVCYQLATLSCVKF